MTKEIRATVLREYVDAGRMFTSVEIANEIKRRGVWISNGDVASYIKTSPLLKTYGYTSNLIRVDSGKPTEHWANCYRPFIKDVSNYLSRDLRAITLDQFNEMQKTVKTGGTMEITKDVTEFMFGESEVRTITDNDGNPWFVGKDVATILGYSNSRKAIADHCKAATKNGVTIRDTMGRNQAMTIIPERDVYRLIMRSKLPEAEKFEEWVVGDVIPSIRKNGGYLAPEIDFTDPDNLMRILENWKIDRKKLELAETKITEDKPKVIFHDMVTGSKDTIQFGEFAGLLTSSGIKIGRNRLIRLFKNQGWIMENKKPYQYYLELGVLDMKETTWKGNSGTHYSYTTYITGKGQAYFLKKIMEIFA